MPVPQDAIKLQVFEGARKLGERKIPMDGPEIKLVWTFAEAPKGGKAVVKWSAKHPGDAPMNHTLCMVYEDGRWQPLAFTGETTEVEIDLESLPGGPIALGVQTTDGFNVTRDQTQQIIRPLKNCIPAIVSPAAEEKFVEGQEITLRGYGYYDESDVREDEWLSWSSDKAGPLGYLSPKSVRLPAGLHTVTLSAGRPGRQGTASVKIFVAATSHQK